MHERTIMNRKLIALDTFCYPYGRETVTKGQRFEAVSDADAEGLCLARRARPDDGTTDKGAVTEAEANIRRGKYKTRALQAGA